MGNWHPEHFALGDDGWLILYQSAMIAPVPLGA
jgi:hypothetical protein